MTVLATEPGTISIGSTAKAAMDDAYRELNLFGDVFERVRADYVEKPDDSKLIESAINGMVSSLDPHSELYGSEKLQRHASRRPRGEFGGLGIEVTHGRRPGQGGVADRRHARRQGRHPRRRSHHPSTASRSRA